MALVYYQHLPTGDLRVILHVAGMASLGPEGLTLEWQASRVEHLNLPQQWTKGEVMRLVLPFSALEEVSYRRRWFRPGVFAIRARNMSALRPLPGNIGPFWSANVARSEAKRARELTGEIELRLANSRLHELESGDADATRNKSSRT